MIKKKLCVVTSCRADYDLLKRLIKSLLKSKKIDLTLIITGQHLSKHYGNTYKNILKDFKNISKKIDIKVGKSNQKNLLNSVSLGIKKIGSYLNLLKPNTLILLGDRYEILSAGIAAFLNQIPITHIHGGEKTQGSYDDMIRHSITKLSDFHFVSHEVYKKRVIQLGEDPKNVFNVGSLGAENISKLTYLNKKALEKRLNLRFQKKILLITINSFIEESISINELLCNLFRNLKSFKNTTFIFTMSNSDLKSDLINKRIKNFCNKNKNSHFFKSLGAENYLSLMKISNAVIGNSSSGILETPSLKIPTINIGSRQEGRILSKNIINSNGSYENICFSIKKVFSRSFLKKIQNVRNPLFKENTSLEIRKTIEKILLKKKVKKKVFYDIEQK